MASASDVRAGAAYYEMYGKDSLSPVLVKARAAVAAFSEELKSLPVVGGAFEYVGKRMAPVADLAIKAGATIGRAFDGAVAQVKSLGSGLTKVGAVAAGLGGAVGGPLLALFKGGTERAAGVARLNRELGVPIETLNKFQYAADRAGVSLDAVFSDTTGRYRDLLADAPTTSPDDARAAADAQRALADATRALEDALLPLIQYVTPVVKQVGEWVKRNAALVAVLGPVAVGLAAVGTAAAVAGVAVSGLVAVGGVALKAVGAALAVITSPYTLALAAVAGATYALAKYTETGQRATAAVKGGLAPAIDRARTVFGALANAVQKGDLAGAFEVASAAVSSVWADTLAELTAAWNKFAGPLVEQFHETFGGLGPVFAAVKKDVIDFATNLKAKFDFAVRTVRELATGVREGVGKAVEYVSRLWDKYGERVKAALEPIKPLLVGLFGPIVAGVALIREAWNGLDANIMISMTRLAKFLDATWIRLAGGVENLLKGIARTTIEAVGRAVAALGAVPGGPDVSKAMEALAALREQVGKPIDIEARLKVSDEGYRKYEQMIRDRQEEAKRLREQDRVEDAKRADEEAKRARERLDAAVGAANQARGPGDNANRFALARNLLPDVSAKGQFGAGLAQQALGYADKAQEQTELLRELLAATKESPGAIGAAVGKTITAAFGVR